MPNAIKMLQDDHNSVHMLCRQIPTLLAGTQDEEEKAAHQLVSMLQTHLKLEEELVYPLVASSAPDVVSGFEVAHAEMDEILAEIRAMPAGMPLRDAVTRLGEAVESHVVTQESTLFPLLSEALGISGLEDLSHGMMARQQELMQHAYETAGAAGTALPKNVYPKL